jgi:ribonuclease HI
MAMIEGVQLLGEFLLVEGKGSSVVVRGDSDLVIKFMNKVYKPHKRSLTCYIQEAREKVQTLAGIKV